MPTSFLRFSVYVGAVFSGRAVRRNRKAFVLLDPYGLRCSLSEKAEMLQNPRKCQKSQGGYNFSQFHNILSSGGGRGRECARFCIDFLIG